MNLYSLITTTLGAMSQKPRKFESSVSIVNCTSPFQMSNTTFENKLIKRKVNYQPNGITLSQQEFSYLERKLLLHCINQIDHELTSKDSNILFRIPVKELDTNYGRMEDVCESITSKKIRSLGKNSFGVIVPFPEARYYTNAVDGLAYVDLTMFANVVPFFMELKNTYTKYDFETMLSIKSVYAQRIFEIIMMETGGRKKYVFNYKVKDLQFVVGSDYDNFADFRRRVLDPAKKELEEKADIFMEYFVVSKIGRKVSEIQIAVKSKLQIETSQRDDDLYNWATTDNKSFVASCEGAMEEYSFTIQQEAKILKDSKLLRKFMLLHTQFKEGAISNVSNPTAYMAQSLGFGKKKAFMAKRGVYDK